MKFKYVLKSPFKTFFYSTYSDETESSRYVTCNSHDIVWRTKKQEQGQTIVRNLILLEGNQTDVVGSGYGGFLKNQDSLFLKVNSSATNADHSQLDNLTIADVS